MKIGILTLPLTDNFGGILQAFALQAFLRQMGHEAQLIKRVQNKRTYPVRLKFLRYFVNHTFYLKPQHFVQKYIQPQTSLIDSEDSLKMQTKDLDAIVVGSDQVWRLEFMKHLDLNFFLDFVQNQATRKVAYAASFGKDSWDISDSRTPEIAQLLQQFTAISVREDNGIAICKETFGVSAVHVVDPTLLLPKSAYIQIFENEQTPVSKGNLLYYLLDETENKKEIIKRIAEWKGLKPFSNNVKQPFQTKKLCNPIKCFVPSVPAWLRGFYDAGFVVTDSFHGTVFSIIFGKPFVVTNNPGGGLGRVLSLLKMFNMEYRYVESADCLTEEHFRPLDINLLNDQIGQFREEASSFLEKALNKTSK